MDYALITGASGGIGREIAFQLAREGYGLYLHYNKNEAGITELINEIKQITSQVWKVKADLAEIHSYKKIVESIHHPIDVLILNSGTSYVGLLTDMKAEEINELIQTNLTSPVLITKEIIPSMVKKRAGKIIVISSIWGMTGASCEVLYSTVKGGLNTFVKALSKELAPSGIHVNGVAPGAIDTPMLENLEADDVRAVCSEIPMGRLGQPKEVADVVTFLTSAKSSYINGEIISITGAWYC